MATKRKVVCVVKDLGTAWNAIVPVVRVLLQAEQEVTCVLQRDGNAWDSYLQGSVSSLRPALVGAQIFDIPSSEPSLLEPIIVNAHVVLVALSGSGSPNLEHSAIETASKLGRPVCGHEEIIGGRNNPGFPPLIPHLKQLFTIMPTENDTDYPMVWVVGPLAVERYRNVSLAELGASGRRKLGLVDTTPVVYWSGHPKLESSHVLSRVCEAVVALRSKLPEITMVVVRHSRDRGFLYSNAVHQSSLILADHCGVRVIEASPDHWNLSPDDPEGILPQFRANELLTFQELLCMCWSHGVIVSGFGTDATVVSPYLGVPSLLLVDRSGFLLGRVLQEEKHLTRLPLAQLRQVATTEELFDLLRMFLMDTEHLGDWRSMMQKFCPFPERNPAELIVDQILADLAS